MSHIYALSDISHITFPILPGEIIFLYGDLAAGKTTLSKHIIQNLLSIPQEVKSPTYTYYNKYWEHIYHFDLYRLSNYDEFFAIWWEEILENPLNISLIEWPEILTWYIKPTLEIYLQKTSQDNKREIKIVSHRLW